jgi:hypothetical protein
MISKREIHSTLRFIDSEYRTASEPKKALLLSKLAILELCGWIEESMDTIVRRTMSIHVREQPNREHIDKKVIRRTFGFEYQDHFRRMLMMVVGVSGMERIESRMDQEAKTRLESTLHNLKVLRDREAHSHVTGATQSIDAPSVTLAKLNDVYMGLRQIEKHSRALRIRMQV